MCVAVVQFQHTHPIFAVANRISVWLPSVLFILSKVSVWNKKNTKSGNKNHCVGTTCKWMTVTMPSIQARTSTVYAIYILHAQPFLRLCYCPAVYYNIPSCPLLRYRYHTHTKYDNPSFAHSFLNAATIKKNNVHPASNARNKLPKRRSALYTAGQR